MNKFDQLIGNEILKSMGVDPDAFDKNLEVTFKSMMDILLKSAEAYQHPHARLVFVATLLSQFESKSIGFRTAIAAPSEIHESIHEHGMKSAQELRSALSTAGLKF